MKTLPTKVRVSFAINLGLGVLSLVVFIASWCRWLPGWLTGFWGVVAQVVVTVAVITNEVLVTNATIDAKLKRRIHVINAIILALAVFSRL